MIEKPRGVHCDGARRLFPKRPREFPSIWVVGYGLDYADLFRTLPYIAALKREVYESR